MTQRRSEGHTSGRDWWISIRSVDNTQDLGKFWKRFHGCFVVYSRVSTKTVVGQRANHIILYESCNINPRSCCLMQHLFRSAVAIQVSPTKVCSVLKNAFRVVFKCLSKVIPWLRMLRLVIGSKDSRQFFNQWESKLKLIAPGTRDFSRASSELQVIAMNCDWLIALPAPVVIVRSNCFGFCFSTVIWKPLYLVKQWQSFASIKTIFFKLLALRGQKYHNNLLPLVRSCVSRQGMTLMAALIVLTHKKCCSLCSCLTFVGRIWSILW